MFDAVDWYFLPIGGWRGVAATGPSIHIGHVPLAFRTAVPTSQQFFRLLLEVQVGSQAARRHD